MKNLVVFDFDHTLLNDNSDTAILSLMGKNKIPEEIKNIYSTEGWTAFMQAVFTYLYDNGITESQIKNVVENLPPVDNMIELITELNKTTLYDMIIISDSNRIFINSWLDKHDLQNCFLNVYTNPAEVIEGMFKITPYHLQDYCELSTKNMCKGRILDEFVAKQKEQRVVYDRIIYVGDGVNDFCPVQHLGENDLACARYGYKLLDFINEAIKGKSLDGSGQPHIISTQVLVWKSGEDIMKHLCIK